MKKQFNVLIISMIFAILMSFNVFAKEFPIQNVQPDKVWTVKFTSDFNESSLSNNIVVNDSNNNIVETTYSSGSDKTTISVKPAENYKTGQTYTLTVNTNVKSAKGKALKQPSTLKFTIINDTTNINVNTRGNSTGNIVNGGYSTIQGDWIYYIKDCMLYKIKTDGTGNTKISDEVICNNLNVNVIEDWIYYKDLSKNLCKIKIDGTQKTKLVESETNYINVVDGWVYYVDANGTGEIGNGQIYKIKTDGSNKTKICNDIASNLNVVGDWIYYNRECIYYNNYDENYSLYKIKIDGSSRAKVNNDTAIGEYSFSQVSNNRIFFAVHDNNLLSNIGIYRLNLDGSEKVRICSDDAYYINVVGDWIYYYSYNEKGIYKIKIDATERIKLCNDKIGVLNVVGDWIYYININERYKLYKMRIDGTERQRVE